MDIGYQNFDVDNDSGGDGSHQIHVPPASKDTRWSHIEDLDLFFCRLYAYHQKHGFLCILLRGVLELEKVIFMLTFCVFILHFVNYDVLFRNVLPKHANNATSPILMKVTLLDAIRPWNEGFADIGGMTWLCITIVFIYWLFRFIKLSYNLYHFWNIKTFYNFVLKIPDDELCNITWHEVQKKICEVQVEHQMCIRKNELTELDIYHRILRSKNYMVAMINKSILPTHYKIPFVGTIAYVSQGFKYNVEMLLFSGTWGLFENWHLIEDYKKFSKRHDLAVKLQSNIAWFAVVNSALAVFVFIWQLVYFFFNYAELLKREPGVLALRSWSLYGRLYLRHFNELDHELDARLRRAYRPASKYMSTFSSPVMVILAQNFIFQAGAVFIVLLCLSIYDEDVLTVEHVFTIITILGACLAIVRKIIPDENCCYIPENLMMEVLSEVHYLPDSWRGQAHTTMVRDEFSQLFQYKATYLLYELISPIVVPLIFYFRLRPKALEIIDFYRNFTVSVVGVGDVCSFSLMDMRKHGNALWQVPGRVKCLENNTQAQAENGKTELSLIHFATMNPTWHPPQEAEQFIVELQEKVTNPEEIARQRNDGDVHSEALTSVSAGLSMIASQQFHQPLNPSLRINLGTRSYLQEGPAVSSPSSSTYYYNRMMENSDCALSADDSDKHIAPTPAIDMSLKTLYLHSVHHKKLTRNSQLGSGGDNDDGGDDGGLVSTDQRSINAFSSSIPSTSCRSPRFGTRITEDTPLLPKPM